jgi:hypothetical protein
MVLSRTTITVSDPGESTYSVGFDFLQDDDLSVYYEDALVDPGDYTLDHDTNEITLSGVTLALGGVIVIQRNTDPALADQAAVFTSGAGLSKTLLDGLQKQLLYQIQELRDVVWDDAFGESLVDHLQNTSEHLPAGGDTGDVLEKASGTSGDVQWTPGLKYSVPASPQGYLLTFDGSGDPLALAPGTSGKVLTSNGDGAELSWEDAAGGSGSRKFVGLKCSDTAEGSNVVPTTGSSNGTQILWNADTGVQASSDITNDWRFQSGHQGDSKHVQFLNAGTYQVTVMVMTQWSTAPSTTDGQESTIRVTPMVSTDDLTYNPLPNGGAVFYNHAAYDNNGTKSEWSNIARSSSGFLTFLYTAAAGDYMEIRVGRYDGDSTDGTIKLVANSSVINIVQL